MDIVEGLDVSVKLLEVIQVPVVAELWGGTLSFVSAAREKEKAKMERERFQFELDSGLRQH